MFLNTSDSYQCFFSLMCVICLLCMLSAHTLHLYVLNLLSRQKNLLMDRYS